MELRFMGVRYILEACMEYQWRKIEKTIPTIPNTQTPPKSS